MPLPPPAHSAVHAFLEAIDATAPGLVTALYLHGSLGFGEFFPGHSDVDAVVVIDGALDDPAHLTALEAAHTAAASAAPDITLDAIHVRPQHLAAPPAACPEVPAVQARVFTPASRFELHPVTWHGVARHGLTVRGPAPTPQTVHQDDAALRAFTLGNLESYWRPQLTAVTAHPDASSAPWAAEWCVLGIARLHHLLATGRLTSKSGAGRHALAAFPARWHLVVQDALAVRETDGVALPLGDGSDGRRGREIAAFLAFALDASLALA